MPCSWRVVQAQLQDQRVSRSTSIPSHPWPHCHTHCHRSAQFCHAPPSSRPIFAASTQSYPPCVASPSAMVCRLPDACRGGHRFPRRYRGLMFGRATVTALVILSMQSAPRAQLAVAAKQQKIPDVKLPLLILSDEAVGDRSRLGQPLLQPCPPFGSAAQCPRRRRHSGASHGTRQPFWHRRFDLCAGAIWPILP